MKPDHGSKPPLSCLCENSINGVCSTDLSGAWLGDVHHELCSNSVPTNRHARACGYWSPLLSAAVLNAVTQSNLGRTRFIWLLFPDHGPSLKEITVEAQTGTEAETTEEYCLLAGLPAYAP